MTSFRGCPFFIVYLHDPQTGRVGLVANEKDCDSLIESGWELVKREEFERLRKPNNSLQPTPAKCAGAAELE